MIAVFVSIMRRWTAAKRPPTTDTPHSGPAFSISASRATSTSLLLGCAFCFLCIISRSPRNTISAPRGCGSPIVPIISFRPGAWHPGRNLLCSARSWRGAVGSFYSFVPSIQPPVLWRRIPVLIRAAWAAWAMPVPHTRHKTRLPRRTCGAWQSVRRGRGPGGNPGITGGRRAQAGSSGRCRALCITCTVVLPYLPTQQLWED